jgi:uncharacterized phage protein (TIGR02218 family)
MSLAAELYEFRVGNSVYRLTNSSTEITYSGQVYTPSAVARSNITYGSDPLKVPLTITLPKSDSFAFGFIGYAPDDSATVTIFRGEVGGVTWTTIYKGRIVEAIASQNIFEFSCESIYTSIQRDGLQAKYEYSCRHLVYSSQCGANIETFTASGVVSNVSNTTLTVPAASSQANGYYSGGIIRSQEGGQRYILSHTGSTLVINRPWPTLDIGSGVFITAGCDRTKATCISKFSNGINFGGFPWIPIKNPFNGRIS